jgi:hypothetical protein
MGGCLLSSVGSSSGFILRTVHVLRIMGDQKRRYAEQKIDAEKRFAVHGNY